MRLDEQLGDDALANRVLWQPLGHMLGLLANNPGLGPRAKRKHVRRLLLGPKQRFGLFYAEEGNRLMLLALLDMRQDPEWLKRRLREL